MRLVCPEVTIRKSPLQPAWVIPKANVSFLYQKLLFCVAEMFDEGLTPWYALFIRSPEEYFSQAFKSAKSPPPVSLQEEIACISRERRRKERGRKREREIEREREGGRKRGRERERKRERKWSAWSLRHPMLQTASETSFLVDHNYSRKVVQW